MNLDRFTQKAQEAVAAARQLTMEFNHSQIEPEHILAARLRQPHSAKTARLLEKKDQTLREDAWRDDGGQG